MNFGSEFFGVLIRAVFHLTLLDFARGRRGGVHVTGDILGGNRDAAGNSDGRLIVVTLNCQGLNTDEFWRIKDKWIHCSPSKPRLLVMGTKLP